MKRLLLVVPLLITLNGCALWDVINPFKGNGGIGVDTEVVAGDKAINTEVAGKKETTNNTADAISNTYHTVNEQYPWWVVLLLVLGWVLPSPSEMGKGLFALVKTLLKRT